MGSNLTRRSGLVSMAENQKKIMPSPSHLKRQDVVFGDLSTKTSSFAQKCQAQPSQKSLQSHAAIHGELHVGHELIKDRHSAIDDVPLAGVVKKRSRSRVLMFRPNKSTQNYRMVD